MSLPIPRTSSDLYRNNLENPVLTASVFSQNSPLRARLVHAKWSLTPDENFGKPPCQIPDSSGYFGISHPSPPPSLDAEGHVFVEKIFTVWKAFESTLTPGMKAGIVLGSVMQCCGSIPIVGQIIQAVGLLILFVTFLCWVGKLVEDSVKPTVQEVIDKIRNLPQHIDFDNDSQRSICIGRIKNYLTNLNCEFHLTKEEVYQLVDQLMDFGLKRTDCEDFIRFMDPKLNPNYLDLDEISSKEHEKILWQSDELHEELFEIEQDIESVTELTRQIKSLVPPIQVIPSTPEASEASSPDIPETPCSEQCEDPNALLIIHSRHRSG
jgi:hypothetical protein